MQIARFIPSRSVALVALLVVVALIAAAWLGKTRLIDEALERLAAEIPGARVVVASAFSYETSLPYGLAVRLLRGILGLMPGDPPETIRARLDSALDAADSEARRALWRQLQAIYAEELPALPLSLAAAN